MEQKSVIGSAYNEFGLLGNGYEARIGIGKGNGNVLKIDLSRNPKTNNETGIVTLTVKR